jgi:hypothetical protein
MRAEATINGLIGGEVRAEEGAVGGDRAQGAGSRTAIRFEEAESAFEVKLPKKPLAMTTLEALDDGTRPVWSTDQSRESMLTPDAVTDPRNLVCRIPFCEQQATCLTL